MMASSLPAKDGTLISRLSIEYQEWLKNTWNINYLVACGISTTLQLLNCLLEIY